MVVVIIGVVAGTVLLVWAYNRKFGFRNVVIAMMMLGRKVRQDLYQPIQNEPVEGLQSLLAESGRSWPHFVERLKKLNTKICFVENKKELDFIGDLGKGGY